MRFFLTNDPEQQTQQLPTSDPDRVFRGLGYTILSTSKLIRSSKSVLVFNGALFGTSDVGDASDGEALLKSLETKGLDATLSGLQGIFHFAWLELERNVLTVATDPLAEHCFLYALENGILTVGSDLCVFSQDRFELNREWMNSYFAGHNKWSDTCALKNVRKSRPSQGLRFTGKDIELFTYRDLAELTATSAHGPRRSLESVAEESLEILEKDMRRLCRGHRHPVLLLSQGADSLLLLAVLRKIGVDVRTTSRLNTRADETVFANQRWLNQTWGIPEQTVVPIENETMFDHLIPSYYLEPGHFTWYTSINEFPRQIAPLHREGGKLFFLGHYGDHVYFHRHRYAIADFLYSNPKLLSQIRDTWYAEGHDAATHQAEKLFQDSVPGCNWSQTYAFANSDFSKYDLREILSEDRFESYVLASHRGLRGINDDRYHRLYSGLPVYSPLANLSHLMLTLTLDKTDRFQATTDLGVQKAIFHQLGCSADHLTKRGSEYDMIGTEKLFPIKGDFPWRRYIEELYEYRVESAPHFERLLEQEPRDQFNAELIRLFSFFLWKDNWRKSSLRNIFG